MCYSVERYCPICMSFSFSPIISILNVINYKHHCMVSLCLSGFCIFLHVLLLFKVSNHILLGCAVDDFPLLNPDDTDQNLNLPWQVFLT